MQRVRASMLCDCVRRDSVSGRTLCNVDALLDYLAGLACSTAATSGHMVLLMLVIVSKAPSVEAGR